MSNTEHTAPTFEEREKLYYQLKFLALVAGKFPVIREQITDHAAYGMEILLEDMAERIFPEH